MSRFPLFGYHYPYYYYKYPSYKKEEDICDTKEKAIPASPEIKKKKIPSKSNPISFNTEGFFDPNEVIFEILGIRLYLDDILILGLLFILYEEEVKDEMLFITLILLLLS